MSTTQQLPIVNGLLKYMNMITENRDHVLLERAIIAAFYDLIGVTQARALEVFRFREDLYIRPRVWIEAGQVVSSDEGHAAQAREPITRYPALATCIERRLNSAEETNANGSCILWLPLWLDEMMSTCLEITNVTPFSSQDVGLMSGILNVYRNYQSLLNYSERDSLTGLLNRKTFDEKFFKMVSVTSAANALMLGNSAERRENPVAKENWLAVVDIDHFKRVNDQFGHLYGDEVLILIANLLRSAFRAHDQVFRFGGEEFVVILHGTTLETAQKVFERFRERVEKYDFPQVGQVTVSLGFCRVSMETPVVILGHADQALYYAKEHGRNRVCDFDALVHSDLLKAETVHESVEFFFDENDAS
jgi:diguanylate cyclase (GGDEF)-like protein